MHLKLPFSFTAGKKIISYLHTETKDTVTRYNLPSLLPIMAIREIVTYPAPVLREKAVKIETFDEALRELADDMVETMYAAQGVGLAANQIGIAEQIVVVDTSTQEDERKHIVLINPVISEGEGNVPDLEGCLSVVEYSAKVDRFRKIRVTAQDLGGKDFDFIAEDRFARIIQHEVDHLLGTLFIDRISSLKRSLYKKKLKKILKKQ
ncbi:MAG: peptide deformylase [Candidatus Electrothrix scaldis]|nr:MAG: peptide deformylase [Candidatus Electrothrix sp. GW3-3]